MQIFQQISTCGAWFIFLANKPQVPPQEKWFAMVKKSSNSFPVTPITLSPKLQEALQVVHQKCTIIFMNPCLTPFRSLVLSIPLSFKFLCSALIACSRFCLWAAVCSVSCILHSVTKQPVPMCGMMDRSSHPIGCVHINLAGHAKPSPACEKSKWEQWHCLHACWCGLAAGIELMNHISIETKYLHGHTDGRYLVSIVGSAISDWRQNFQSTGQL